MNEEKTCRYCHENGSYLVSPCACTGTHQYVHTHCLDTWMNTGVKDCELCRAPFRVTVVNEGYLPDFFTHWGYIQKWVNLSMLLIISGYYTGTFLYWLFYTRWTYFFLYSYALACMSVYIIIGFAVGMLREIVQSPEARMFIDNYIQKSVAFLINMLNSTIVLVQTSTFDLYTPILLLGVYTCSSLFSSFVGYYNRIHLKRRYG